MMHRPPELKERSRNLRKQMTEAEKKLWERLRAKGLGGFRFNRQHIMGSFILDFFCAEAKLAVEVDGSQHATEEGAGYDAERTKMLDSMGVQVIRFWNNQVLGNIEPVLQEIYRVILERTGKRR